MSIADEPLDLVDQEDRVVGVLPRSEVYRRGLTSFRVINAFLVNARGQLWIPRRAPTKRLFPLALDASVGGHVASGEGYLEAFRRELWEELRIDLAQIEYRVLGAMTPAEGMSAFMQVYEIPWEKEPEYNRDDFVESFWLLPQQAIERLRHGDVAKHDLPRLIRRFYAG